MPAIFWTAILSPRRNSVHCRRGRPPHGAQRAGTQEIELALKAAPVHLRDEATVYVFGNQGYEKVRTGKNGFNCMVNRDGIQNGDTSVHPTCWDPEGSRTILPVMLRVGELLAQGSDLRLSEHHIAQLLRETQKLRRVRGQSL